MCAPPHRRLRLALSPATLEGTSRDRDSFDDPTVGVGSHGEELMRRANGRDPSTDHRATAYTAEERETLRRGLRILARVIARAHLRRQASQSGAASNSSTEDGQKD